MSQGTNVNWNHGSVFLMGDIDRRRAQEILDSQPLVLELHDRDVRESEKERRAKADYWEFQVDGREDDPNKNEIEDGDTADVENDDTNRSKKKNRGRAFDDWFQKPQDIFEVDTMYVKAQTERMRGAADRSTFGQAEIKLGALLSRANETANAFVRTKMIVQKHLQRSTKRTQSGEANESMNSAMDLAKRKKLKLTDAEERVLRTRPEVVELEGFVRPLKRKTNETAKEREAAWDFSEAEHIVRRPGDYILADTRLILRARLARPIFSELIPTEKRPLPIFERAAFIMPYDEPQILRKIRSVHKSTNTSALPGVSLRSYQLSDEQRKACEEGILDVMTGFQLVDKDMRVVVVEGLADGSMKALHDVVSHRDAFDANGAISEESAKKKRCGVKTRVLMNSRVRFTERLYGAFDVDLKMIRLRDPLRSIVTMPDIYNRSKVSPACFDALNCIARTERQSTSIRFMKNNQLFPSVGGLLEVENLLGDAVTVYDMEGVHPKKKQRSSITLKMHEAIKLAHKRKEENGTSSTKRRTGKKTSSSSSSSNVLTNMRSKLKKSLAASRSKIERKRDKLDMSNIEFERHLRRRAPKDFIGTNVRIAARLKAKIHKQKLREYAERDADSENVFIYGSQKLNSTTKQMDAIRREIAQDRSASYTFSKHFYSGTVAPVNPAEILAQEKAASRKRWLVSKGFVYPAPRESAEFYKHPKKPSEAEIEELRTPWVERGEGGNVKGTQRGAPAYQDPLVRTSNGFDTTPILGNDVFEQDPKFWKSVHLCGEGLAKEREEAKANALHEWKEKVVVDNVRFLPHVTQRRTNQIDRYSGLLKSKPQKRSLRLLRRIKSDRGVYKSYEPLPISSFNADPYADPGDFAKSLAKSDDRSKMIGEMAFTSVTSRSNGPLLPAICKAKSHRSIRPLERGEMRGALWERRFDRTV
eukprot:g3535.t1